MFFLLKISKDKTSPLKFRHYDLAIGEGVQFKTLEECIQVDKLKDPILLIH